MEVQLLSPNEPEKLAHPWTSSVISNPHADSGPENGSQDGTDAPYQKNGQKEEESISNLAWSHSDESSNDFRSDIFTKPTLPMLEAIIKTSLGDCEMEEDVTTNALQDFMAGLMGHDEGLLVLSGTMGNQVALRSALVGPPHSVLADHRAHVVAYEGGGASTVCGAMLKEVVPSNGHHLTLDDVKRHSTLTDTIYDCPTRVISLENPLWGTVMPLEDVRAISQWARAQDPPIHMHLDGARLWEAVVAGAFTLREIGECFDSIQMCLSKGLGSPMGSIIVGSSRLIKRAKWSRHIMGGGMRASGVIAGPARWAVENVFLGGQLKAAQDKARRAGAMWEHLGGKLQLPTETNMVWLDLKGSGLTAEEFYPMAEKFDIKMMDMFEGRLVFHYQISEDAMARLGAFFRTLLANKGSPSVTEN